jgi:hypothetical protein
MTDDKESYQGLPKQKSDTETSDVPAISMVANAWVTEMTDIQPRIIVADTHFGTWRKPIEQIRRIFDETLKKTGDRKAAKEAIADEKKSYPASCRAADFRVELTTPFWNTVG